MSQHDQIIKRLRKGWCTGLQALYACGTMKSSSRVSDLRREGYVILDKQVEQGGKRYKSYRLVK